MNQKISRKGYLPKILLLVLLIGAVCGSSVNSAQDTLAQLRVVVYAKGVFKDKGNGTWVESNIGGTASNSFKETSRSQRAVFLSDDSRNVKIELNIAEQMIYYSDSSRSRMPLYTMTFALISGFENYYRVRTSEGCLQNVYNQTVPASYTPEIMGCDNRASQQWNIIPRTVNGVTVYRWRNLLSQMQGIDLCLTSPNNLDGRITMSTCADDGTQYWVNTPPSKPATIQGLRTLRYNQAYCAWVETDNNQTRYRRDELDDLYTDRGISQLKMDVCKNEGPNWSFIPI